MWPDIDVLNRARMDLKVHPQLRSWRTKFLTRNARRPRIKITTFTAIVLALAFGATAAFTGPVTVTNVTAIQRPADPIVDISYD